MSGSLEDDVPVDPVTDPVTLGSSRTAATTIIVALVGPYHVTGLASTALLSS